MVNTNEKSTPFCGLELCADDRLTKPFSARGALAHIHAVLRRVALDQIGLQDRPVQHGIFNLDPIAHRAIKGQLELNLYAREFDLLNVLIDHAGRVISRAKSMAHVWGNQ